MVQAEENSKSRSYDMQKILLYSRDKNYVSVDIVSQTTERININEFEDIYQCYIM